MSTRIDPVFELQLLSGGSADLEDVTQVMSSAFDERFGEAWTRSQCAGILPMPGVELVLARDGNGTAQGLDQTARNREPQPSSFDASLGVLDSMKRLEDVLELIGCHADSGIAYRKSPTTA